MTIRPYYFAESINGFYFLAKTDENKQTMEGTKKKKANSVKSTENVDGAGESPSRISVVQCLEKADPSPAKMATLTPRPTDDASSNVNADSSIDELSLSELKRTNTPKDAAKMPAKKSPKLASSPPSSARKRSGKPTYLLMVHDAIVAMKERSGSSAPAISKWIQANSQFGNGVYPQVFKTRLSSAIKQGVKENRFLKVKGSYKISSDVSNITLSINSESKISNSNMAFFLRSG